MMRNPQNSALVEAEEENGAAESCDRSVPTFVLVGAAMTPAIVIGALVLGFSILTALVAAVLLSAPATLAVVVVLRGFRD